jgi:hypothetical protein
LWWSLLKSGLGLLVCNPRFLLVLLFDTPATSPFAPLARRAVLRSLPCFLPSGRLHRQAILNQLKQHYQAAARQFLPEKCPLKHALQTPAPHNNGLQPSRITTNCSFYPSRSRRAPQQQCLSRTSGLGRPQARRMPWTSLAAAQHTSTRRTQRDRCVP